MWIDFREERDVGGGKITEDLALEVDKECPVALQLAGIKGTGEGIVWREEQSKYQTKWPAYKRSKPLLDPYRFKTHGPTHSEKRKSLGATKSGELTPIEKAALVFVESFVTEARLNKGLDYLRGGQLSFKEVLQSNDNINKLSHWVMTDLKKELSTEMATQKFDKGAGKTAMTHSVTMISKEHFLKRQKE